MFTVTGSNGVRPKVFACGTAEQALEKLLELLARRFEALVVKDPQGRTWSADEFQRVFNDELY